MGAYSSAYGAGFDVLAPPTIDASYLTERRLDRDDPVRIKGQLTVHEAAGRARLELDDVYLAIAGTLPGQVGLFPAPDPVNKTFDSLAVDTWVAAQ
jgi:hypothetical protein